MSNTVGTFPFCGCKKVVSILTTTRFIWSSFCLAGYRIRSGFNRLFMVSNISLTSGDAPRSVDVPGLDGGESARSGASSHGCAVARINRGSWEERVVTAPGMSLCEILDEWGEGVSPVCADLFGTPHELQVLEKILVDRFPSLPRTRVAVSRDGHGGAVFHAVKGVEVGYAALAGGAMCSRVEFPEGVQVVLSGLKARDPVLPPAAQTGDILEQVVEALSEQGMGLADTVRTWFYNRDILDWYLPFNAMRTTHFLRNGVLRMPASTGVGTNGTMNPAITAKVSAIRFSEAGTRISEAESPLQCHAFSYGSAFSRGILISTPSSRIVHVSGTAAIEPDGKSAHEGDPASQIELTLRVIEALLEKSGMGLHQTTRAIAYFPDPGHAVLLADALVRRGLRKFPLVVVPATICRGDLLFEMELDASDPAEISGDFSRHAPILNYAK